MYASIYIVAFVLITVCHVRDTLSVHFIHVELGIVAGSIRQIEHTATSHVIVHPIANIS